MSEIQLKATNVEDKPVRIGDLPIVKTNILENVGQMDKGVVGGYNGAFPLTAASEGGIYLLPSTGKFYICETAYNGAQISAPNSNFVELSVWKNHDRLNNLINFNGINNGLEIKIESFIWKNVETYVNFNTPFKNKCLAVIAFDDIVSGGNTQILGIDNNTISNLGFTATSKDNPTTCYYIAFGY